MRRRLGPPPLTDLNVMGAGARRWARCPSRRSRGAVRVAALEAPFGRRPAAGAAAHARRPHARRPLHGRSRVAGTRAGGVAGFRAAASERRRGTAQPPGVARGRPPRGRRSEPAAGEGPAWRAGSPARDRPFGGRHRSRRRLPAPEGGGGLRRAPRRGPFPPTGPARGPLPGWGDDPLAHRRGQFRLPFLHVIWARSLCKVHPAAGLCRAAT